MINKNISLIEKARDDFPIIAKMQSEGNNLIYLDHAATTQKPYKVIEAVRNYYMNFNANVHRGAHQLSSRATDAFEGSRLITANFIKASSPKEIIFTRNATEAINLVARCWGEKFINQGDEILLTLMEHHSNIVPWQQLCERKGCVIKYAGINKDGALDIDDLRQKITHKTKILSMVHVSNTLGCCNPVNEIAELAHNHNCLILLDACQSLAHQEIDVNSLNVDFLAGSSHKLCGPTGVGFLWGKEEILNHMPPFLGGGEMIEEVCLDHSTWADLPHKFEAGTPPIGEAIGFGEAIKYLQSLNIKNIQTREKELTEYLFNNLSEIPDLEILGPTPKQQKERGSLATFNIKGIHSDDIATILDSNGICIRSGHHCCQPIHKYLNLHSTARASLNFTSTFEEIDIFKKELISAIQFLKSNS